MQFPSNATPSSDAGSVRMPGPGALAGQMAVVTGGSSGIGLAIARRLAGEGARIAVIARDDECMRQLRLDPEAATWLLATGDVARAADVERFIGDVQQRLGGFDILVSNAGFHHASPVESTTPEAWKAVNETHAGAAFLFSRAAFASWKRQGRRGRLVFVASKSGVAASGGSCAYAAAKAAQLHLARCLAEEGGPHGIRVNCVLPDGVIRGTGIFSAEQRSINARRRGIAPQALEDFYAQRNALKATISPADVAQAVFFLCDEGRSASISGAAISVDGGMAAARLR